MEIGASFAFVEVRFFVVCSLAIPVARFAGFVATQPQPDGSLGNPKCRKCCKVNPVHSVHSMQCAVAWSYTAIHGVLVVDVQCQTQWRSPADINPVPWPYWENWQVLSLPTRETRTKWLHRVGLGTSRVAHCALPANRSRFQLWYCIFIRRLH